MKAAKTKGIAHPGDKPTGKKRKFAVTISTTIKLDESVIKQGLADDGYDGYIMTNPTLDQVLEHLAFNLVKNGLSLSQIDGYANCPDSSAFVEHEADVEVKEIK